MQIVVSISGLTTPYDFESITVSTSAIGLTTSKWKQTGSAAIRDLGNARMVMISVEGRVRYRVDGTNPTATVGHILNDGDIITLASESQFLNFKAIRENAETADATFRVTYMR